MRFPRNFVIFLGNVFYRATVNGCFFNVDHWAISDVSQQIIAWLVVNYMMLNATNQRIKNTNQRI